MIFPIRCKQCGKLVPPKSRYCKYCGHQFPLDPSPPSDVKAQEPQNSEKPQEANTAPENPPAADTQQPGAKTIPRFGYNVDIVFCLDLTLGMHGAVRLKDYLTEDFFQDFTNRMLAKRKRVDALRVRIIAFRDYYYDREYAMTSSDFFRLPEQNEALKRWVCKLHLDGGGDDPEDGLEALALAMKSDWTQEGVKRRHIIFVLTDDGTHELGFGKCAPNYPKNMPQDFAELSAWWGSREAPGVMDEMSKRLILFAPNRERWISVSGNWNNTIQYETELGYCPADMDCNDVTNAICNFI